MRHPYAPTRFIRIAMLGLALLCPNISQAQDFTSGLIGHWELDETSGSSIADSAGSNTGTWVDGTGNDVTEETTAGKIATALTFDGVNDYISIPSSATLDDISTEEVTVSTWVKLDNTGAIQYIVTKFNGGGSNSVHYILEATATEFEFCVGNCNGGQKSRAPVIFNQWVHLVGIHDGTDTILYVNTVQQASAITPNTPADSGTDLHIGQRLSYANAFAQGQIDDVRIYNRALSTADITALYNDTAVKYTCSSPDGVTGEMLFNNDVRALQYCNSSSWVGIGPADTLESSLIGHWKLDETSGSSIADSSGNGHNGTWSDGTGDDVAEETTTGSIDTALTFDGNNDRINIPYDPQLELSDTGGAIVAWIKLNSSNIGQNVNWPIFRKFEHTNQYVAGAIQFELHQSGPASPIYMSSRFDGTQFKSPNTVMLADQWYHVVLTWNTTQAYMYLNGAAEYNAAKPDTISYQQDSIAQIGQGVGYAGTITNADGDIDDVRVYNRTLSATEVSKLYGSSTLCTAKTANLAGHWTLNETSGSSIADTSGNGNTGTWNDGTGNDVTEETTTGQDGTAIDFDGAGDRVSIGSDASIENVFNGGGALSMWIYPESWGGCNYGRILEKAAGITGSGGWSLIVNNGGGVNPKENIAFFKGHSTTYSQWTTPFQSITLNTWNHITVSYSDDDLNNNPTIYINGTAQTLTQNNPPVGTPDSDVGTTMRIGYGGGCGFDGVIDDVRVYNSPLSETEVSAIYGATGGICSVSTCAAPSGTTGEIVFNTDYDVMQYCNGSNWIAMGPPGDGGAGCTNPTGLAAELRYNTDSNVVQYCEGDEWIAVLGTNNASMPTNGLIGYWKLDETSGTTAVDSSSSGNDGTLSFGMDAATDTAAGQVGTSLDFDGSDDQVIAAGTGLTTATTLSAWAYARSYGTNGSEIICEGGCDSPSAIGQRIVIYPANINFSIWNATIPHVASTASVPSLNSWHHYVGTFDGTVVKLYIDGVEAASTNYTGVFSARTPLRFGAANSIVDPDRAWNGMIDEVRIYNRALSSTEILSMYNATK